MAITLHINDASDELIAALRKTLQGFPGTTYTLQTTEETRIPNAAVQLQKF